MGENESSDIPLPDRKYKKWYTVLILGYLFQGIVCAVTAIFNIFDIKILVGKSNFITPYPVLAVLWLLITVFSCVCAVLSKNCSSKNKTKRFASLRSRFVSTAVISFAVTAMLVGTNIYFTLTSDADYLREDAALSNGESVVVIKQKHQNQEYYTVYVYKQYGIFVKRLKRGITNNGEYDVVYDEVRDCGVLTVYQTIGSEVVPYEYEFDAE